MAENASSASNRKLIDDLRKIVVFADLTDEQIDWLAGKFEELHLDAGQIFIREGDPAVWLTVILDGEVRIQREGAPDAPIFVASTGQVTGVLPYSRLTHYGGTGRAVVPTRMLRLHKDLFPEMLQRLPEIGQRLVAIMADRIRETTKMETQRDKLMALGKLSAGLAHELNNPAAAAQRAAASLRETLETVRDASIRLSRHALTAEKREIITRFEREAGQYAPSIPFDPLVQSDREERITHWLDERKVQDAWKIAPVLAEVGVEVPRLERLATDVGGEVLSDALIRIASLVTIARLIGEIENSTKRISDLVQSIKEYSHMDQASIQEIDIHRGLESTLTILGHQLRSGVKVIRNYDPNLPRVCAYGGELNQVWTNLIDNAIAAMKGKGELRIHTQQNLDRVLVEIGDNGPGIPEDVKPHIFDPFFTTKDVGEGTGLGLDTVSRIVRKHHGEIKVLSQPGDTRFQVELPVKQPKTQ